MAAGRIVLSQYMPARDRNGRLVPGALLNVYTNGTTTKASIYAEEALTTPLANPVAANSSGQFPAIWASDAITYTLSITAADGTSIGNPSVFDDYSVSTDYDAATAAIAEAAAAAAEAFLEDALAIEASGDDAAAIATRAAKAANLSDLADGDAAFANLDFVQAGAGASTRSARTWARERSVSVKDFGALGDGSDATASVLAAYAAGNYDLYFPPGEYELGEVGLLGAAGIRIRGAGRGVNGLLTTIRPLASMTNGEAIFFNQVAATGTAAYGVIEDISFDLNGQDCIAIDLSSCNNFNINRCHVQGGTNYASAAGVGYKFGAPLDEGSYSNTVSNCSGDSLAKGVQWDTNANSNMVIGGEFLNCLIGADAAPATYLDTPRVIGTRFEGCDVNVKVAAIGAQLIALRHEGSATADVQFVAGSQRAEIFGGYTAGGTGATILNPENCTNLVVHAGDLGWYDVHDGAKFMQGVHVVSGVGQDADPARPTNVTAAMMWTQMAVLFNTITLEGVNNSFDNTCIIGGIDANNELSLEGFDRKFGIYRDVNIGGGDSVNPMGTGVTDLGKAARRWRFADLSSGVKVAGNQVVGAQGAALPADATDLATALTLVNAIKARMVAHGLVAA